MALRRSDGATQIDCDINNANQIPIPWPSPIEKAYRKDVPDISQSFHGDDEIDQEPQSKQHRRFSHPKAPTLYSNCHEKVLTNQNSKIKCVEKAHFSDTSPNLNDEKHCCFSKRDDNFIKDSHSVLPCSQKLSKTTHSAVSSESDLWEYLKRQDAKLDAIQEQVSRALTPSESPKHGDTPGQKESLNTDAILAILGASSKDLEASSPRNHGMASYREDLLIKCVLSQGEQIQKLQEQVNWLMLNISGNDKMNSCRLDIEDPNIASSKSPNMLEGFLKRVDNQNNSPGLCHKDIEVSKQSTSTMTSMTFNGNDKLLIREKLTVVTDSAKYQKEVSAQCSYISNGVNTPLNQTPTKNASSNIERIKPQKSAKSAKKNLVGSGSSDVSSPNERIHPNPIRMKSPSENVHEKTAKVGITESRIVKYLPNYETVLKNINEKLEENTNEPVLPTKKTTPKETSKPKSKRSPLPKTSPLNIKENEKQPCCRSSSELSHDITPKLRKKRTPRNQPEKTGVENESYLKARYGLSSPNLSVATMQYLESYGLVRDKSSEPRKKTRPSLPKRYTN